MQGITAVAIIAGLLWVIFMPLTGVFNYLEAKCDRSVHYEIREHEGLGCYTLHKIVQRKSCKVEEYSWRSCSSFASPCVHDVVLFSSLQHAHRTCLRKNIMNVQLPEAKEILNRSGIGIEWVQSELTLDSYPLDTSDHWIYYNSDETFYIETN
jgi:hypothetical protein